MQPAQGFVLFLPSNGVGAVPYDTSAGYTAIGFSENEVVSVRVLSVLKNNMLRIAVKGAVLEVKALSAYIQEGAFLLMRTHIAGQRIILMPHREVPPTYIPHADVFTQLGIPPSDLAATLIAFFRQTEQPLQTRPLLQLLSQLHIFNPHEQKAAFAASLLYSRGIELSPQLIEQCMAAIFGLPFRQASPSAATIDDADMFRFINHVKTSRNHWVVFPFEKQLDTRWKGSAAFLLDIHAVRCLECRLRVRSEEKQEAWTFALKNRECLFSRQEGAVLLPHEQNRLAALLQECLNAANAGGYTVRYEQEDASYHSLASIDVSV